MNRREFLSGQDRGSADQSPSIAPDLDRQKEAIPQTSEANGINRREFLAALPIMVAPLKAIDNLVSERGESSSRTVKPARFEFSLRKPEGISQDAIVFVEEAVTRFINQNPQTVRDLDETITRSVLPAWKKALNVDDGRSGSDLKATLMGLFKQYGMQLPANLRPEIHIYYSQTLQPRHYHGGIISSVGRHIFVNAGKAYDLYPEELAAGLAHETGHCAMNSYEIGIKLSNHRDDLHRKQMPITKEYEKFNRDVLTYIEILADQHSARTLGDIRPMVRFLEKYEGIAVENARIQLRKQTLKNNSISAEK